MTRVIGEGCTARSTDHTVPVGLSPHTRVSFPTRLGFETTTSRQIGRPHTPGLAAFESPPRPRSHAMSTHNDALERSKLEAHCLLRALIPMPADGASAVQKIVAVILVLLWSAITLSLSLEGVDAVPPPHYGLFTALIFLLVGRLWELEVEKLIPNTGSDK